MGEMKIGKSHFSNAAILRAVAVRNVDAREELKIHAGQICRDTICGNRQSYHTVIDDF